MFRSKQDKHESTQPIASSENSTNPSNVHDRPSKSGLFANIADDSQAALVEFFGTTTFLTLAFGGVQASAYEASVQGIPNFSVDRVMYISLSFGLSLLVSAWLFFRVTGGLFNPNISLALLISGVIGPVRFVLYCIAQLVGGIAAAALVLALTPGALQSKYASFRIWTGMNTARSFGPAAVTGFPFGTQWIYWVGPGLGSLFAATFYAILKHYHYWKLNPGADGTDRYLSPPDPVAKVVSRYSFSKSSRTRGSSMSVDVRSAVDGPDGAPIQGGHGRDGPQSDYLGGGSGAGPATGPATGTGGRGNVLFGEVDNDESRKAGHGVNDSPV
ncbi:aquaporin-like protein [Irpex rosettiformis]|uniref:Aquaporin-like protein n=1 Tax=Irpex rosettiformis TaxID=378272 RepID=A0ACB8U872_9APHY|nr:aquaporin-like protein [Irpex rosettiformis]